MNGSRCRRCSDTSCIQSRNWIELNETSELLCACKFPWIGDVLLRVSQIECRSDIRILNTKYLSSWNFFFFFSSFFNSSTEISFSSFPPCVKRSSFSRTSLPSHYSLFHLFTNPFFWDFPIQNSIITPLPTDYSWQIRIVSPIHHVEHAELVDRCPRDSRSHFQDHVFQDEARCALLYFVDSKHWEGYWG